MKRRIVSDRGCVPLAVVLTGVNVRDSKVHKGSVDAVEPIKRRARRPGYPRERPEKLLVDKGQDFPRCRRVLRERSITARIARRGVDSSEQL